jgi:hypothetical protein
MRLVLLGPPGSGKGTQAVTLADEMDVPHIATGDLFRAEMAAESELGKLADEYISHGNLVPDEVVNEMMRAGSRVPTCDSLCWTVIRALCSRPRHCKKCSNSWNVRFVSPSTLKFRTRQLLSEPWDAWCVLIVARFIT